MLQNAARFVDAMIDSDLGKAHVERLAGKWSRTDI